MAHDSRYPPRPSPERTNRPFDKQFAPGSLMNAARAMGILVPPAGQAIPPGHPQPGEPRLVAMLQNQKRLEAKRAQAELARVAAQDPHLSPVDPVGDTNYLPVDSPPADGEYLSRLVAAGGYNRPPTMRDVYSQLEGDIDEATAEQRAAMDEAEQGYSPEGRLRLEAERERGRGIDQSLAVGESRIERMEDALAGRTSEIDRPAPEAPGRNFPRWRFGDDAAAKVERDAAGAATVRKIKNAEAASKKERDEEYEASIQRGIARTSGEFERNEQIDSQVTPKGPRVNIPEVVWTNPETGKKEVTESSKRYDPRTLEPVPYEDKRGRPRIKLVRIRGGEAAKRVALEGEVSDAPREGAPVGSPAEQAIRAARGYGDINAPLPSGPTPEQLALRAAEKQRIAGKATRADEIRWQRRNQPYWTAPRTGDAKADAAIAVAAMQMLGGVMGEQARGRSAAEIARAEGASASDIARIGGRSAVDVAEMGGKYDVEGKGLTSEAAIRAAQIASEAAIRTEEARGESAVGVAEIGGRSAVDVAKMGAETKRAEVRERARALKEGLKFKSESELIAMLGSPDIPWDMKQLVLDQIAILKGLPVPPVGAAGTRASTSRGASEYFANEEPSLGAELDAMAVQYGDPHPGTRGLMVGGLMEAGSGLVPGGDAAYSRPRQLHYTMQNLARMMKAGKITNQNIKHVAARLSEKYSSEMLGQVGQDNDISTLTFSGTPSDEVNAFMSSVLAGRMPEGYERYIDMNMGPLWYGEN